MVYPKADEPQPFRTVEEIKRQLAKGDQAGPRRRGLWASLYLRVPEISALLACVESKATHPWIYPLVVAAAHTGMRRSELLRAEIGDVDLAGGSILV